MKKETGNIANIRQKTHKSVDNIMEKAESIEESGKEKMNHLKEKAIMVKVNVDNYIKKNPEKSVLIAAGVGIAVGAILVASLMKRCE